MADNLIADPGAGGATFATDDIGGVHYPRTKVTWGADGTADDVAAGAAALPIQDGGNTITVDGAVTLGAAVPAGTNNIGDVDVLTVPAPLSTAGGGTEATALRVTVATDSTGVLSVDDNGGSLTVDGTITANAGTNLSTALLALEAGGNLAAAATSLAILDDWDESDRAKVNPIVGQAGVQGGAGTITALTQRVVLASDQTTLTNPLAVTGTVTVDNGGTFAVQVSSIAAGNNNIGDVDVASSALPTGASTAAKQPALGAAGTASTDVITVQGIAAMTPLLVTASAGTNLNTSALALEAGGNLAAAATSLAILDDWDESDRAKVNPIVGQAGVQGGAGTITALTQRVVLASDQTALTVPLSTKEQRPATATVTAVADTASSTTLLASTATRLGASIHNDSSAVCYVKCGTTASATDYTVRLVQYAYYEVPFGYTGRIDAIWASDPGDGAARITEWTA